MKLPKQPTIVERERQALAPYNFVELPDAVVTIRASQLPDQSVFHASSHSGWIDCRLVTESPTFVRAGLTLSQVEGGMQSRDVPEFFYVWERDDPVIPGSTLRGLLRAMVEIAGFGKISEVSKEQLIYRALGDTTSHGQRYRDRLMRDEGGRSYTPLMAAGYMRKRGSDWYIQPAEMIDGTSFARIKIDDKLFRSLAPVTGCNSAFKIHVRVGPYEFLPIRGGFLNVRTARVLEASARSAPGLFEATLARSGPMFSKRTEAVVYPPDEKADLMLLSDTQIDNYRNQITKEQENLLGRGGVLKEGHPIFFTMIPAGSPGHPAIDFFGHCRMLRLPYEKSPLDHVPEHLRREADIDLAEAIFGYTKTLSAHSYSSRERRYAGRVAVGDATLCKGQQDIWLTRRPLIPRILASPKPTTFQHYLVQTRPDLTKAGSTRDGKAKYDTRLADYSAPSGETTIRGHKLYWHKGTVELDDIKSPQGVKETQATQIQPLRTGVEFDFRVRFENLAAHELGAILWVLRLGADDRYRLKLGMGKPLGMGAIRIVPKLRLIDREARYALLLHQDHWATGQRPDEAAEKLQHEVLSSFERFVLEQVGEPGARRLEEVERIRQLLALLSWPGPDTAQTRYLEIEHPDPTAKRGKRNEYDGRPVLPGPLAILRKTPTASDESVAAKVIENAVKSDQFPEHEHGTVVAFGLGPKKSYGFIRPDKGQANLFVHVMQLSGGLKTLRPGQRVIYKPSQGQRGPEAVEVRNES